MRVDIYHVTDDNGRLLWAGWTPAVGGIIRHASSYIASATVSLEDIWRDNNAIDGTEYIIEAGIRSLSVGDIVVLEGIRDGIMVTEAHTVEPIGWRKLTPDEFYVFFKSVTWDRMPVLRPY